MSPFLQLCNPLRKLTKFRPNRCVGIGGSMSFLPSC